MEEKNSKVKFVKTHFEKTVIDDLDAWDMGRYLTRLSGDSGANKDRVIKALIEEVCLLSHFIAHSHPEYIDFLNKAKNIEIYLDDDSLEWNINPPSIPEGAVFNEKIVTEEEIEKTKTEW